MRHITLVTAFFALGAAGAGLTAVSGGGAAALGPAGAAAPQVVAR
jgi:hypothetical protein